MGKEKEPDHERGIAKRLRMGGGKKLAERHGNSTSRGGQRKSRLEE